jgi:serine protease Do
MNSSASTGPIEKLELTRFATPKRGARAGGMVLLALAFSFAFAPVGDTGELRAIGTTGFADVVAKVKPAVIAVTVKLQEAPENVGAGEPDGSLETQPYSEGSPLFRYFSPSPEQKPQKPPAERFASALGSGFFVSPDGYAVTNAHVVEHGISFKIAADDGTIYTAKVIGADLRTDLALLKIEGGNNFPYVKLAEHDPHIGDWAIAIGNPYGLGGTVTVGVVSALGRHIATDRYDDFIQIDAPINKGNSGGPTFDTEGNVIGVNTAIYSPSGGSVGIGFAIPAETVKTVVQQLKDKGVVTRGALGVETEPVTPDLVSALGLKSAAGALVAETEVDGAAAMAGIKPGDVLTKINDHAIASGADLAAQVGAMSPGATVNVGFTRDGKTRSVSVVLGELPTSPFKVGKLAAKPNPSGLGMDLGPAPNQDGAPSPGVEIIAVDPNGVAAEKGLTSGDVILDVSGKPVTAPGDVRKALNEAQDSGKSDILLRVRTMDQQIQFVALPIRPHKPTLWTRLRDWLHSL